MEQKSHEQSSGNEPSIEAYSPWNQSAPARSVQSPQAQSPVTPAVSPGDSAEAFQKGLNSYRWAGIMAGILGIVGFLIAWQFHYIVIALGIFGILGVSFGWSARPKSIIAILLGIVAIVLNVGATLLSMFAKLSS